MTESDHIVFVTEDISSAGLLRAWGLEAVHRPKDGHWTDDRLRPLAGRQVVIVQGQAPDDLDLQALMDTAARVGTYVPPELVRRVDPVSDLATLITWNRYRGISPEAFAAEAAKALTEPRHQRETQAAEPIPQRKVQVAESRPRREVEALVVRMADVKPRVQEWLWRGRIPLGSLTTIAGDPGLGKSFLTLDMAARVSLGCRWPDDPDGRNIAGAVVTFSAEDEADAVVAPRLIAAGADMRRVFSVDGVNGSDGAPRAFNLSDLPALEDAIDKAARQAGLPVRLVVIDPVTAYVGGSDDHRNAEVRALLAPLTAAASRGGFAIVLVTHLNKNSAGRSLSRVMGSIAWTAAARAAWAVAKGRDDPARRLFLPIKNNLSAEPTGLAYRLESTGATARVAWENGPVAMHADEALREDPKTNTEGDGPGVAKAREFLRRAVELTPARAVDLFRAAEAEGIGEATLKRAKAREGLEAIRVEHAWWWRYPPQPAA